MTVMTTLGKLRSGIRMIVEIGLLKDDPGTYEDYEFTFLPESGGDDCLLLTPVHVVGSVTFGGNMYLLNGSLTGKVRLPCSRCLTPVDEAISVDFEEEYDEQEFPGEDAVIDIGEIASQIWLTSIPMQPLCRSDCKGLCPRCGKNLNESDCDCPKTETDPRMEALRDLLDKQE